MLPVIQQNTNSHQHAQHPHWLAPAARARSIPTFLIHVFGIASLCILATSTTVIYLRHQRMGYSPLVESFPGQATAAAAIRLPTGQGKTRPPLASTGSSPEVLAAHTNHPSSPEEGTNGLVLSATTSQLQLQRQKHLDMIQQQLVSTQHPQQQQQLQHGQLDAGQALLLPGFWGPGRAQDAAMAVQAAVNPHLVQQAQQLLQILQTPPHLRPQAAAAAQLSAWMGRQALQHAAKGPAKAQRHTSPPSPAAAATAVSPTGSTSSTTSSGSRSGSKSNTSTSSGAAGRKQHPPDPRRSWADPFAGVAPWHTRPVAPEAPAPWSSEDLPEPPATVDDPVGGFRGDRAEPHPVVAAAA